MLGFVRVVTPKSETRVLLVLFTIEMYDRKKMISKEVLYTTFYKGWSIWVLFSTFKTFLITVWH